MIENVIKITKLSQLYLLLWCIKALTNIIVAIKIIPVHAFNRTRTRLTIRLFRRTYIVLLHMIAQSITKWQFHFTINCAAEILSCVNKAYQVIIKCTSVCIIKTDNCAIWTSITLEYTKYTTWWIMLFDQNTFYWMIIQNFSVFYNLELWETLTITYSKKNKYWYCSN